MTEQVLDSDFEVNRPDQVAEPPLWGWQVGDLLLDLPLRRLQREGKRVALQQTPLRLLCLLWQRSGRPWSRRELLQTLWPRFDHDSGERSLNTAMRKLRRAIGDDAREPRLIETLRTSGYRWIGPAPLRLSMPPPARAECAANDAVLAVEESRGRPWMRLGLFAATLLLALSIAIWQLQPPLRQPWLVFETVPPESANDVVSRDLKDSLQALLGRESADREPLRITLSLRGAEPASAAISGRGTSRNIELAGAPFGAERLIAEVASRLPADAVRHAQAALPASAEAAYAEAGSVMMGATTIESVRHALALLESVLSAAPQHSGALRMYARAQRALALFGRDPVVAREHRLAARDALRRALRADPNSGAVAADIAGHLYWGEWNAAAAADWFALARREAPADADILHGYAWYALANEHAADAIEAMHAALAIAPLNTDLHADLGWFYFRSGRYDDALRQCRAALLMNAQSASAQTCEERALAEQGRFEEAWQTLRRHAPPWLDERSRRELESLDAAGAYRAAMHLAARDTRARLGPGYMSACLEAIAGERGAAESDLAAAVALADPGLHLSRVSPELVRLLGAEAVRHLADAEVPPLENTHPG